MRIYANQLKTPCKVHDLETGRDLREVVWVDCEAGTAEGKGRRCGEGTG